MDENGNPFWRLYNSDHWFPKSTEVSEHTLDHGAPLYSRPIDVKKVLNQYPNIKPFYESLDRITEKFDYIKTPLEKWDLYYVDPDRFSILVDKYNQSRPHIDHINFPYEAAEEWFSSIATFSQKTKPRDSNIYLRYFVTGEVGCGKSTFIKRGILKNYKKFQTEKTIPARVEYSKIGRSKRESKWYSQDAIRFAIIDSLYREINHFFCGSSGSSSFVDHPLFNEGELSFQNFLMDRYVFMEGPISDDDIGRRARQKVNFYVAHARNYFRRSRQQRKDEIRNLDLIFKQLTIEYVYSVLEFEFSVFFDGFDYLKASDLLYETHEKMIIDHIKVIYRGSRVFSLLDEIGVSVDFHQIYIMRDVSYSRFFETSSSVQPTESIEHFRIAPPGSKALVSRAVIKVCEKLGESQHLASKISTDVWHFDRYMRRLLRDAVIYGDRDQVSNLGRRIGVPLNIFNGNARKEMHFLRLVIVFLLTDILPNVYPGRRFQGDTREIFSIVDDPEFRRYLKSTRYRLIGRMLCREFETFRNSLVMPGRGGGESGDEERNYEIKQREGMMNYVDNIYNYDEHNQAPLALMSKIRVCQLLIDNSLRLDEIEELIKPHYTADVTRLLYTMCETGFLKTRRQNGYTFFSTEPLGVIVVTHLVHKVAYIEHVFPHIALPPEVRANGIKMYNREDADSADWAFASLVNGLILQKYVELVEDRERKYGYRWHWIAQSMYDDHVQATDGQLSHFRFRDPQFRENIDSWVKNLK